MRKKFISLGCWVAGIVIVGDWEKVKDQVIPFGDVTIYDAEGNVVTK